MRILFPRTDMRTVRHRYSIMSTTPSMGLDKRLTRLPNTVLAHHSVLHTGLEPQMRIDKDILLPDADIDALDVDIGRVGIEGLPMESALLRVRGDEGFFDGRSDGGIRGCR